jgi:hypothetical protein
MSILRLFGSIVVATFFIFFFEVQPLLAQSDVFLLANESVPGVSLNETKAVLPDNLPTFGIENEKDPIRAFESILLNYIINPIFLLSGGVAVVVIMYSSFLIITSRAQEDSLTSAKTTLIWAFAGLALVILAYTIVSNLARIILEVL